MGVNTLAAAKELGNQLALRRKSKIETLDTEKVIFFDVLGLFMVSDACPDQNAAHAPSPFGLPEQHTFINGCWTLSGAPLASKISQLYSQARSDHANYYPPPWISCLL